MDYNQFIQNKVRLAEPVGFQVDLSDLNPKMFDWQRAVSRWTLYRGNVLGALDVGLGKTILMCEWLKQTQAARGGKALIVCPLSVAPQTIAEATNLSDMEIVYCRTQAEVDEATAPFIITNQEYILSDAFEPKAFNLLALDEASKMLKAFRGATRNKLTCQWAAVPYRSAWTATPAPNRLEELLI